MMHFVPIFFAVAVLFFLFSQFLCVQILPPHLFSFFLNLLLSFDVLEAPDKSPKEALECGSTYSLHT